MANAVCVCVPDCDCLLVEDDEWGRSEPSGNSPPERMIFETSRSLRSMLNKTNFVMISYGL